MKPLAVVASCNPSISFCSADMSWRVWTLVSAEVCCIMAVASMGWKGFWYLSWAIISWRNALPSRPPSAEGCGELAELPSTGPIIFCASFPLGPQGCLRALDPESRGTGSCAGRGTGLAPDSLLALRVAGARPAAGCDVAELQTRTRQPAGHVLDEAADPALRRVWRLADESDVDGRPRERDPHPQAVELGHVHDDMGGRGGVAHLRHCVHDPAGEGARARGGRRTGGGGRGGAARRVQRDPADGRRPRVVALENRLRGGGAPGAAGGHCRCRRGSRRQLARPAGRVGRRPRLGSLRESLR